MKENVDFFSSLIEQKNSDHEVTEAVIIKNEFDDVQNRWWSFLVAVVRVVDVSGSVTNTGQIHCGVQTKIFSFFLFTGIFWKKKNKKIKKPSNLTLHWTTGSQNNNNSSVGDKQVWFIKTRDSESDELSGR